MKILVTGYTGQLGFDVVRQGLKQGHDMIGIGSKELDITNEEEVVKYIKKISPEAIIHCAAYTKVDDAEDNKEACFRVNVQGTKYLAAAAKEIAAKFMYISTDYVFEGSGISPFLENDEPKPSSYYGFTKYKGEIILQDILEEFFVVRISWVFGLNGNNFVKTMLKLAETKTKVNVVGDQFGSPTYTFDLAVLLIDMVQSDKYGIYHASNEGYCSWAQFAEEIYRQANKRMEVNSISTDEYPTKAIRPKNSRMSKLEIIENGFTPLRKWQEGLHHFLLTLEKEVK